MSARAVFNSNKEYHADKEHLSASGAKAILKSPAYFKHQQDQPMKSDALDFGTTVHELLLGLDQLVECDFLDWKSDEAKKERARIRADGKTPMIERDLAEARAVANAIKAHPMAAALLDAKDAICEQSIYWDHWRARPDWYRMSDGRAALLDIKTTALPLHGSQQAIRHALNKEVATFGYHIQAAIHGEGVHQLTGLPADNIIVWASKKPPYHVALTVIDEDALKVGRLLAERAMNTWLACQEMDEWPGIGQESFYIGLPSWAEGMGEES